MVGNVADVAAHSLRPPRRRRRSRLQLAPHQRRDDGGKGGAPPLLRHLLGCHGLGHHHRRHHHVQELAEAHDGQAAREGVPGVLRAQHGVHGGIRGRICVAPPPAAALAERQRLAILLAAAGFDLANLLIFTPRTLKVMQERHKVERILGIGGEGSIIGWRQNAQAARSNATLATKNVRFRVAHCCFSATATIISAAGLVSHSLYRSENRDVKKK